MKQMDRLNVTSHPFYQTNNLLHLEDKVIQSNKSGFLPAAFAKAVFPVHTVPVYHQYFNRQEELSEAHSYLLLPFTAKAATKADRNTCPAC